MQKIHYYFGFNQSFPAGLLPPFSISTCLNQGCITENIKHKYSSAESKWINCQHLKLKQMP